MREHLLRHGDQAVAVVELGGGLRDYTVGGRAVLDGFGPDEPIMHGRGQILVPWPNRIRDGRYEWAGQLHQLPITEPERGHAIHGLLRGVPWTVLDGGEHRVRLTAATAASPGYPWVVAVTVEYELGPAGLTVRASAENQGPENQGRAPYGFGQHPYLTVGTEQVDDAVLTIPAGAWLRTDERQIPVATEVVTGTPYDFRAPRPIGAQKIDTACTDLIREPSGRATVRLATAAGDRGVDVWLGPGLDYVQVFSADIPAAPDRSRRGLAIEPMSCPPNAFQSGVGVVALAPGDRHLAEWGITPW